MADRSELLQRTKHWLMEEALPFWTAQGLDPSYGGFIEGTDLLGQPLPLPRRAMIQGRQLYVLRTAWDLGFGPKPQLEQVLERGSDQLVSLYSLPEGGFVHSLGLNLLPADPKPDLYAQAFVLFGLANSYAVLGSDKLRARAKLLLAYLRESRSALGGGFTEIGPGGANLYQSNPHMHLFEAALAWMAVDQDPEWRALADELLSLCLEKFIDPQTGALAEHFSEGWVPQRHDGRFLLEPGHHFEWSWLLEVYSSLTGSPQAAARRLFDLAEKFGVDAQRGVACDELWSDFTVKKSTARYWPQCERTKAALRLGEAAVADRSLNSLFAYLQTPVKGLCFDHQDASGKFPPQAPRASFLYHVANAMAEYLTLRPRLG